MYKLLPLDTYLKMVYKKHHKKTLNIKNPKRYTEKLFWLKKYNGTKLDLIQRVYDKYRARDYISEKGYGTYLPTLYSVHSSADEIDFSKLPNKYVIKISQSNGYNFINNGFDIDENAVKKKVASWLSLAKDLKYAKRRFKEESYYFDGNAIIMCEEYLCKENGSPCDEYVVFCFNGKPKLISVELDYTNSDGSIKKEFTRNTYDTDWNIVPVNMGRPFDASKVVEKPKFLDTILEISSALSSEFLFARVDFYDRGDRLFIGEITFIPQGGGGRITPEHYDDLLGSWLKIPGLEEK